MIDSIRITAHLSGLRAGRRGGILITTNDASAVRTRDFPPGDDAMVGTLWQHEGVGVQTREVKLEVGCANASWGPAVVSDGLGGLGRVGVDGFRQVRTRSTMSLCGSPHDAAGVRTRSPLPPHHSPSPTEPEDPTPPLHAQTSYTNHRTSCHPVARPLAHPAPHQSLRPPQHNDPRRHSQHNVWHQRFRPASAGLRSSRTADQQMWLTVCVVSGKTH